MLSQLQSLKEFVHHYALIAPNDTILLAVSGGKDSVAMTHLLHQAGFKMAIAHCNFNLRADEAKRDEDFTRALADNLKLPFHVASFDTLAYADKHKISIQMAARDLRYAFFEELCHHFGYQKIATAHHQNDATETLLINLIRGTGIAGLHGIKPKRGNLIRPMLCFTSQQIEEMMLQNHWDYVEDSSNASAKYTRNKVRLKIIPAMKEINPSLEQTFEQNIAYFNELENFVAGQITSYKSALFEYEGENIKIGIAKLRAIKSLPFVLTQLLMPYGFNASTINDFLKSLDNRVGKVFQSSNYRLTLDRKYVFMDKIVATENSVKVAVDIEAHETIFKQHVLLKTTQKPFETSENNNFCQVDGNKLIYPLSLRNWQSGDFFIPLGMKGKKKLSDFFINQKIPLNAKNDIPILVNGDEQIIWVAGYRLDNRFKITSETKKITTFELKNKQHD